MSEMTAIKFCLIYRTKAVGFGLEYFPTAEAMKARNRQLAEESTGADGEYQMECLAREFPRGLAFPFANLECQLRIK